MNRPVYLHTAFVQFLRLFKNLLTKIVLNHLHSDIPNPNYIQDLNDPTNIYIINNLIESDQRELKGLINSISSNLLLF